MGMFLPFDIQSRISGFMAGNADFPFIKKHEMMGIFYIFGKDFKVRGEIQQLTASDMARRALSQMARDVRLYSENKLRLDSDFIREGYTKRALQITIESRNDPSTANQINQRICGDPDILSNCFAQHIAIYRWDYFFELLKPFKENQIPSFAKKTLHERMLMLGFNKAEKKLLPFDNTVEPFLSWLRKTGGYKK